MKELKVKTEKQKDENISIESKERRFLKSKLESYVKSNTKFIKNSYGHVEQDNTSRKNSLLTDYILRNFTLREVYIIFCKETGCYGFGSELISESKKDAINCSLSFNSSENECFKIIFPPGSSIMNNIGWSLIF